MLKNNTILYGTPRKYTPENFSHMIICGDCGCAYKKKRIATIPTWVCEKDGSAGQRCNTHPLSEEVLKKAFIMMFNRLQQHKETVVNDTIRRLLDLRKLFFNNSSAIDNIDTELAELAEQNSMYVHFYSQKIIDEIIFMEQTGEIKQRISELRNRRIKLMSENEEENCIEQLRAVEQLLDSSPQAILFFDFRRSIRTHEFY